MTTPNAEELAEKVVQSRSKVVAPPRRLGVQEKRQLEKLIDSEYALMARELDQHANELKRQRLIQIEQEYQDRNEGKREVLAEYQAFRARVVEEFRVWRATVQERGFEVEREDRYRGGSSPIEFNGISIKIPGKERVLGEVANEVNHVIQRAKHALERKRVESQRALMMSGGMPPEAQSIMSSMPDATEMLLNAMEPGNAPNLLAIRAVQIQEIQGDIVEGLVLHVDENMADRG